MKVVDFVSVVEITGNRIGEKESMLVIEKKDNVVVDCANEG